MNYFSFRILFVCIFFPPVMYVLSIQTVEEYLQSKRTKSLQKVIIQDYEALYSGGHSIKEEITNNVGRYLRNDTLSTLGVITKILVTTKKGRFLYPYYFEESSMDKNREFDSYTDGPANYLELAQENYQILNDGIRLSVDVEVKHNSWLTNSTLILYVFSSVLILYWYYRRRISDWVVQRENEQKRIDLLSRKLDENERSLEELSRKEKAYIGNIQQLRHDKEDLKSNVSDLRNEVETQKKKSLEIDEILEEMERIEEQASKNQALKEEKEHEIIQLREEIDQLKQIERQSARKRKKDIESLRKRFAVIYKNLILHEKAIASYLMLTQDLQLKAEEIIHRLNDDDSTVGIKRKFFSKKGKSNVFEVIFSYSGRIYFKKRENKKIEVIAIGTKNTQEQDITFLESLS